MSIMHTIGSFTGKSAAYAWEGTRLGASQFAQGAKEGYADKAAELAAKRQALLTGREPVKLSAPKRVTQNKVGMRTA